MLESTIPEQVKRCHLWLLIHHITKTFQLEQGLHIFPSKNPVRCNGEVVVRNMSWESLTKSQQTDLKKQPPHEGLVKDWKRERPDGWIKTNFDGPQNN